MPSTATLTRSSERPRTGRPPRLLLLAGAATAACSVIPLLYLFVRAGGAGWQRIVDVIARPRTAETIGTSVALMLVVVAGCLLIGVPAAWLVARTQLPRERLWLLLLALPLAIPSYVAAYAWIAAFPAMNGFWAAALILTLVSFP